MNRHARWFLLVAFNVLGFCMLGFYQKGMAGSPGGSPPFAGSTETRLEMVGELKEIKDLLKEQNALLRSGEVKVIVTDLPKLSEPAQPAVEQPAPADSEQK